MGLAFGIVLPFVRTAIGIVRPCPQLDCWPYGAEASASGLTSASCYHVEENIFVAAIVETILKLREIQRQIFFAHVVVGAKRTELELAHPGLIRDWGCVGWRRERSGVPRLCSG